jgi:5-formyltetrahydrofolate cyclo-ligase
MGKAQWRTRVLAQRAAVPAAQRAAEATALAAAAGSVAATVGAKVVGAYVPFDTEPGSTAMLDALVAAGARVLLPLTGGAEPLRWAVYDGVASLAPGRFGIPVPRTRALPPRALGDAALVLVPTLAVDRRGVRLGRGAGHYDRSLGFADPAARLVAVVRDPELVDRLPAQPHDIRMGWALTPTAGVVELTSESPGRPRP